MTKPNWFVALPIPAQSWLPALLDQAPDHLRRFHPDDVHLTVAFLGACGEDHARRAFAHATARLPAAFELSLGELAPMGNPRRPSAWSFLLDRGREPAAALIRALRDPLIELAEGRPDTRPPKPHITILRPRRSETAAQRAQAFAWARELSPPVARLWARQLALYTWSADRQEHQFRLVDAAPLGEAPTPAP